MPTRVDLFLDLSALLTGFDRVQLHGTGVADSYRQTLEDALPEDVLSDLFAAYEALPPDDGREAAVARDILGDPRLGAVAQNLIILWYCGTWAALPDDWRGAHGSLPLDTDRVISPEAYVAGLQWVVAGAHPIGARQQGFGAWALAPEGMSR
jgi:hypothetical protein